MYRKIIALGLSGALLAGLMTGAIYAKDEQSVYSQTGYRLYVDEISETSGTIYSDISQVTEDYDIIEVKMPDGQTVDPENVKYTVDASGDYSFEIKYQKKQEIVETKLNDQQVFEEIQKKEEQNQTDVLNVEDKDFSEEVIEKVKPDTEDLSSEIDELYETEEVTLAVSLPSKKEDKSLIKEEKLSKDIQDQYAENIQNSVQTTSEPVMRLGSNSKFNSLKIFTIDDFPSRWTAVSNGHMNNNNNPDSSTVIFNNDVANAEDNANGAMFRFGTHASSGYGKEYWLQQGAVFSNIKFDLDKDFILEGSMKIGDAFGGNSSAYNDKNIQIDGGVTISFVPENQISAARQNAFYAKGAGYRLGAFNTLNNSIVCEYDAGSPTYYKSSHNTSNNFVLNRDFFSSIGDNYYAQSGNAVSDFNGKNIFNLSDDVKGQGMYNVPHIGVSTTDVNGLPQANESSSRTVVSTKKNIVNSYRIEYSYQNKQIVFIFRENGLEKRITQNISQLYKRLSSKKMKLVFTFGAAYLNQDRFDLSDYFGSNHNGQIEIWVKELLVTPDLKRTNTKVRWLESGTSVANDDKNHNAYFQNNSYDYNNRKLWPVAGDTVYVQFSFKPYTDIMPQPESVIPGKLYIKVKELNVVDENGNIVSGLSLGSPEIYCKKGNNDWWYRANDTDYITISSDDVTNNTGESFVRVKLQLPQITDSDSKSQYYVTGKLEGTYEVGKSKTIYTVQLMDVNSNKIPVSRPPKFIGWNGTDYYNSIRVISSKNNIDSSLRFTGNYGSKNDSKGRPKSIHYGVGYKLFSVDGEYYIYEDRNKNQIYDIKNFNYKTATMSNLKDITTVDPVNDRTEDLKLDFSEDRRFILEYKLQDPNYRKTEAEKLTGNPDRGKATGKRVIWASDNVVVSNGYEFFAKNVVMSKDDFKGFDTVSDKGKYYRKIAKEAGVKIFKTSNYDFDDLINGNYTAASGLSGNGKHDGVNDALQNPGNPYDVTLQYKDSKGTISTRTIKLTIQEDSPKVMSIDGKIADQPSEKIIFNGENFTVSGTFKLMKDDGSIVDYDTFNDKANIKVALYKKNPSNKNKGDKFYRWSNRTQADTDGQDTSSSGRIDKLQVPATITDNKDGTFTVIFKLYNHQNGNDSGSQNWITKEWDHLSQYRIYCWTDKNGQNIKYSQLDDRGTDSVEINHVGNTAQVPSATTTMRMIEKENGNLPTSMFEISNIILNDDGTELSDKRNTTTVGLKSLDGLTEEELNKADHDYYYEIHVNESNTDNLQRPYVTLTQSDTQKSFNATYLTYDSNKKSYTNITKTNTLLGSIAYPSNKNSLPQSIRFGMRADRQTGITSNTKFMGTANFKFVRKSLQEVANP